MSRANVVSYVIQEYPPASQTFVWREVEELRRQGAAVDVFCISLAPRERLNDGVATVADSWRLRSIVQLIPTLVCLLLNLRRVVRVFYLPPHTFSNSVRQVKALLLAIFALANRGVQFKSGHVHAHFFGPCLDVALYMRAISGDRLTTSVTGHAGDVIAPRSIERLVALSREVDGVVCASQAVRDALLAKTGRHATVVRCGVQVPAEASDILRREYLRITTVARLVDKKGIDICLETANDLRHAGIGFRWTIVGDGPERDFLHELAASLSLSDCVEFRGPLSPDEVLRHLQTGSDVMVLPCRSSRDGDVDGIPVALIEASACGIPCVSTDVGGIVELIRHGKTGIISDSDRSAITSAITDIYKDRTVARHLGLAARELVAEQFSIESEARKMFPVLFDQRSSNIATQVGGDSMKIVQVIASISPAFGGPSTGSIALNRALRRSGVDATLVSTDLANLEGGRLPPSKKRDLLSTSGVKLEWVEARSFRSLRPRSVQKLWRLVRHSDFVHMHGQYSPLHVVAFAACFIFGIGYGVQAHGSLEPYHRAKSARVKSLYMRLVGTTLINRAKYVLFASESEQLAAADVVGARQALVVPLGVSLDAPVEDADLASAINGWDRERRVLFLGRFAAKKRLDVLLEAWATSGHVTGGHLIIAGPDGDWTRSSVEEECKKLGIGGSVTVVGPVHGGVKTWLLRSCGVFVLPSDNENFGISVAEAMASRAYVVVTRGVAASRHVENAQAGRVISAPVAAELADALNECLADDTLQMASGERAAGYSLRWLSWDRVASSISSRIGG